MKAYTDIEQSKKLSKILPIESADMCYRIVSYNPNDTHVYQAYCFAGTLESDIEAKDKEMYDLKHELISVQVTCSINRNNR